MKVYVAAGWFSDEQEKARQILLNALKIAGIPFYSPKEDMLYVKGETDAGDVFHENVTQILESDMVLVSTEGKDMGTIFECGYAFCAGIPVVYYYDGPGVFNLMLAKSARAVLSTSEELKSYLMICRGLMNPPEMRYEGEME